MSPLLSLAMIAVAIVLLWAQVSAQRPPGDRVMFSDVTRAAGIDFLHESGLSKEKLIVETVGSGLAWIDYDNDGRLDLNVTNYGPNQLFRNSGERGRHLR